MQMILTAKANAMLFLVFVILISFNDGMISATHQRSNQRNRGRVKKSGNAGLFTHVDGGPIRNPYVSSPKERKPNIILILTDDQVSIYIVSI